MSPRKKLRRGAALLLVIAVIVALVVIAAPFALSMRLHERSSRAYAAQSKARHAARAGRNLALRRLLQSHGFVERARDKESPNGDDYDGLAEFTVPVKDLRGVSVLETNDPRGVMVSVEAADEQGKLDLNTASPHALGAMLGVTSLTRAADYDEDKALEVADTADFYSDGDPRTIDGVLYLRGEFIAYRDTTPTRFLGLIRGLYLSQPLPFKDGAESIAAGKKRLALKPGELVYDARGWKIAAQQLWSILSAPREGSFADFQTASSVKSIADWDFGRLRLGLSLLRYGLDAQTLRRWGLEQQMKRAGLDPAMFERAPEKLDDAAFARQQETEDRLADAGLPVDTLKNLGSAFLADAARQLDASEGDARKRRAVLRSISEGVARRRSLRRRQRGWLKGELALTLRHMIVLAATARDLGTLGRIEFEELRESITAHAVAPAGRWTDPCVVLAPVPYHPEQSGARLEVQDTRFVTPGSLAKISPVGGGAPLYRLVVARGEKHLVVLPKLDRSYGARVLEVSTRLASPLNVNTAPRRALAAVFVGLGLRGSGDQVSPEEARALSERLVSRREPIKNHVDFSAFLTEAAREGLISQGDVLAIARCAINPADPSLERWTAPLSFASNDVYTIEATGIVNGETGRELARYATREVAQVAPPERLTLSIDSQADFEHQRLFLGGRWALPQRHKGLLTSFPRNVGIGEQADRSHAADVGELRLRTWEAADAPSGSGPGRGTTLHFRKQLLGARAPQDLPEPARRTFRPHPGIDEVEVELLEPGAFRGWFRLDRLPGPRSILFDIGDEGRQDRLVCFYDDATRELVFRVYDEALDEIESQAMGLAERRAVEVRGPIELKPGNWYHLTLAWRGAAYDDLLALVDNKLVTTRATYTTYLTQDIDDTVIDIPVEDASRFPSRGYILIGGTIDKDGKRVGGELLEYLSRSSSSFRAKSFADTLRDSHYRVLSRPGDPDLTAIRNGTLGQGSRLSPVRVEDPRRFFGNEKREVTFQLFHGLPHKRGCPVRIFGYSDRISRDRVRPSPLPNGAVPPSVDQFDILPAKGARLRYPLPEHTPFTMLYRPRGLRGSNATPPRVNDPRPEEAFAVAAGETNVLPCVWLAAYPDPGPQIGGFPPRGILMVGSGEPEYIGYTGLDLAQGCFTGLIRSMFGTVPQNHRLFEPVTLASLSFTGSLDKYGLPSGGERVVVSLYQDASRFEWFDLRRAPHAAFPLTLRFRALPMPRPTFPAEIDKDSRWSFMTPLLRQLSPSSQLPIDINERVLAGKGRAMKLRDWLKDIAPLAFFRGFAFTGLGSREGGFRGPGIACPAGTPALPIVRGIPGALLLDRTIVTLTDDRDPPLREEARVSHAVFEGADRRPLFALSDFTSRDFDARRGARFAKWPTGRLVARGPAAVGGPSAKKQALGTAQDRGIVGRVDELKLIEIEAPKGLLKDGMAGDATVLAATEGADFTAKKGVAIEPAPTLLKVGREIMALSEPKSGALVRGFLGSAPREHAPEQSIWRLDVPAVALAETSYQGALAERFQVRPGALKDFPEKDGYVAIDRGDGLGPFDVIAYKRRRGAVFERPLDRFGRGFADHNFGSGQNQNGLAAGDVLVQTPVRFHDRYEEGRSSLDGTLFSFSRTLPGARFESIDWEVEHPNPYTQIVVRVRVDGAPDWETARQNATGNQGLFVFKDPPDRSRARGQKRRINLIRKRGDQIDVQVYLTFRPGAFFEDGWKQTPVLKSLKIHYYQPTRVRAHEERQ